MARRNAPPRGPGRKRGTAAGRRIAAAARSRSSRPAARPPKGKKGTGRSRPKSTTVAVKTHPVGSKARRAAGSKPASRAAAPARRSGERHLPAAPPRRRGHAKAAPAPPARRRTKRQATSPAGRGIPPAEPLVVIDDGPDDDPVLPGLRSSLDLDHLRRPIVDVEALPDVAAPPDGGEAVLRAGDVDADWLQAASSGDETPGGENPTPDQDLVDLIGRSLGVEYADNEELKGADKIAARDRHRWELDPQSSEDYRERGR